MTNSGPFEILICSICRKRIAVETGNTDEYGNAVHEACYISRVTAQTGADLTGFIVVQRVNRTPSLASCARCERKFFTPATVRCSLADVELRASTETRCIAARRFLRASWDRRLRETTSTSSTMAPEEPIPML